MVFTNLLLLFCVGVPLATGQHDFRLPESIIPSRYVVDLFIPAGVFDGTNNTFEGNVSITFTATTSTTQINLHHRVNLTSTSLYQGTTSLPISLAEYNSTTEVAAFTLTSALSVGTTYQLDISYYGIFEATEMHGFYTSSYKDENNNVAYLVTTQFQPTHARHAFPCFDEPQYKAVFDISLTYPKSLNALCNSAASSTTDVDTIYAKTVYSQTTKMSTYLVAIIISAFTCSEADSIDRTVVHRICSRDEEKADRAFGLEVGTPLLRSLESMTGIKYGSYMPKMDQVAIPDFSAGAMENWGLVTYRETGLLFSEEDTANNYRKSIATVIAHEFTHMWFGNLVTCKSWDYTFLNEGFARFYQYFASAATQQLLSWELDKMFNIEQVQTALLADSTNTSQALTSTAETQSEISGKFGTISYNKGASIFRMIQTNIMGADNFIYGIRHYLSTYSSQATVPGNLWSSLSLFVPSHRLPSNTDLSTVLHNWVEESGHPVVYVSKSGNDVILTQQQFLFDGDGKRAYYVPITYTVSDDITKFSNTTIKAWLTPEQSLTLSNVLSESDWIIINNRQSGFYRVDYDETLWSAIKSQLHSNHLSIDVMNRAQLVSDAYNFARSGRNSGYGSWTYNDLMGVLSYLEYEVEYYPWFAAITGNSHLLQRIGYDSTEGKQFTNWMLKLMQNVYKTVPFETIDNDNQVYSMKQQMILLRVCEYGESTCISKSKELFADYKNNGVKVPKNLRSTVYCNALRHSDSIATDFNFLWNKYSETKLMSEILTILSGLGCTQDPDLLQTFLGYTIDSSSGIRYQDFTSVWSYVYTSSKIGTNAALQFIADNYAKIVSFRSSSVDTLISSAAAYVHDEDQLTILRALSNISGISDGHNETVQKALSSAASNIAWAASLKEDVKNYLAAESTSGSGAEVFAASCSVIVLFVVLQKFL